MELNPTSTITTAHHSQPFDIISSLPQELATLAFSYLSKPDLASANLVSKNWMLLSNEESLWNKSLGYAGSEHLYRSEEGIQSNSTDQSHLIFDLLNYPVLLKVTRAAMEKIDRDFRENSLRQSIDIKAVALNGEILSSFTITTNVFGRIQSKIGTQKPDITLEVGSVIYGKKINNSLGNGALDRIFSFARPSREKPSDVIKEFKATLLSGTFFSEQTHDFACEYFEEFPELLVLSMDFEEGWKLKLMQKVGGNLPKSKKSEQMQQWMQTVSVNPGGKDFTCPITHQLFKDSVFIPKNGQSYERKALVEWVKGNKGPLPVHKVKLDKLFERASFLKEAIADLGLTSVLEEKISSLESLALHTQLLQSKNIPENLNSKQHAQWLLDFIVNHSIFQNSNHIVPCILEEEDLMNLWTNPLTQELAEVIRKTHKIVDLKKITKEKDNQETEEKDNQDNKFSFPCLIS